MSVPDWWEALLLGLAAWRIFHLLAYDDILDRPRRYVTRLVPTWEKEGDATGDHYRERIGNFIECPYCLGLHMSLAVYLFWLWLPEAALVVSTPLALNAAVILMERVSSE